LEDAKLMESPEEVILDERQREIDKLSIKE
jgi:hypothetical protein